MNNNFVDATIRENMSLQESIKSYQNKSDDRSNAVYETPNEDGEAED